MNLQSIILNATRQVEDRNRQNNRENKGMPGFKENQFQSPNFPQANLSQQQAPVLNPIVYQGKNSIVPTRTGYDPEFHLPALNEALSIQEQFNQQVPKRPQPIEQRINFVAPQSIPVSLDLKASPDELNLFKRLILAESKGEGLAGMAGVARSVLNRQTMVNQYGLAPSKYNAKSGGLGDIIRAKGQFSPITDGSINKPFTQQQMALADQAIALALNTPEFKAFMRSQGLNESQVGRITNATGFRNPSIASDDPSQNHNTVQLRNHRFNADQFSKNKLRAFNFGVPTEYENVAGIGDLIQTVQKGINTGLKKTGEFLAPIIPKSFKLPKADGLLVVSF
jgi:hypothetical protein